MPLGNYYLETAETLALDYTQLDEHGTAKIFDIVPIRTHRLAYIDFPRILISSHGDCDYAHQNTCVRATDRHVLPIGTLIILLSQLNRFHL